MPPEEFGFKAIGSIDDDGNLTTPEKDGDRHVNSETVEPQQEYNETLILMNGKISNILTECFHALNVISNNNDIEGGVEKAAGDMITKIEQVITRKDLQLSQSTQQEFMSKLKEMFAQWIKNIESDKSQLGGFFSNIEKAEIGTYPFSEIIAKENLGDNGMERLTHALKNLRDQMRDNTAQIYSENELTYMAKHLRELSNNPNIYRGGGVISEAVRQCSENAGIPEKALLELIENPLTAKDSALDSLSAWEKKAVLKELEKEVYTQEENLLLDELDIMGLENIDDLIESIDVSKEQKDQWRQMLSLEIPEGSKVKVIYVQGGANLDMSGEAEHLLAGLQAEKLDVVVKPLNNMELSKEELLTAIKTEMEESGYDFVIPFFSTHGGTPSLYVERLAKFGFTEVNAKNDVFFSENTVARQKANKKMDEYQHDATKYVDAYIEEHGTVDIKHGESVDIAGIKFRCEEGARSRNELIERLTMFLFFIEVIDRSVTTNDLYDVQSEVAKDNNTPIIYMLDACFSGSATNDKLSELPTTKAILASTTESQIALNDNTVSRGAFMHQVFECMKNGCSLGEAFVRTDILLNYSKGTRILDTNEGGRWQNPKAFLRDNDGTTHQISRLNSDQSSLPA